jgi:transposase-like protein
MERKRYAREFKLEAVRLVKERGSLSRRHRVPSRFLLEFDVAQSPAT